MSFIFLREDGGKLKASLVGSETEPTKIKFSRTLTAFVKSQGLQIPGVIFSPWDLPGIEDAPMVSMEI